VNRLFASAQDLLDDFRRFLPEPAAQARLRTQQDLLEIESYEKVEPQAPVNGRRRKRARYDLTDDEDEDEASTYRAARLANWTVEIDPNDVDLGILSVQSSGHFQSHSLKRRN
jgi:hypothetical protein